MAANTVKVVVVVVLVVVVVVSLLNYILFPSFRCSAPIDFPQWSYDYSCTSSDLL